ncbi:hypothetical protein F4810DRAFT_576937 [Camillea tinctor]|nr:hypothetical protein F4810DRAFT_576937 [Camillea tinctor]
MGNLLLWGNFYIGYILDWVWKGAADYQRAIVSLFFLFFSSFSSFFSVGDIHGLYIYSLLIGI